MYPTSLVGLVRMLLDILVRAIVIARVRGCRFWMFGALWDTAFQVAVSPFRWVVEKGIEGAGRIKNYKRNFDFFFRGDIRNSRLTTR
jgi:hypothetical protein